MLADYIDDQLRGIRHSTPTPTPHIQWTDGIRDKVSWMPQDSKWILKYDGPSGAHERYCEEKSITFEVQADLEEDEYRIARQKTFFNACCAWNHIDESARMWIILPEHQLNVDIVPMLENTAMSHAESGRGSDE